jgi:hypothetical protein
VAKTDLRKARGPLTLLAFLLLLSGVLLYLKVSPDQTVALDESSPVVETFPSLGVPYDTTALVPTTTAPVSTLPPSSVPTTATIPGDSTTTPTTSVATTAVPVTTPTTSPLPPIKWRNVMPSFPAGGSASLVADNGDRYAANITYSALSATEAASQIGASFGAAGWDVTITAQGSVSSVAVAKSGIQGTVRVSPSGQGALAELDLRRAS